MKTGPIASYLVVDPRGIWRGGKHLPPGESFGARPGVHVRRWLAAGRIAVMPLKLSIKRGDCKTDHPRASTAKRNGVRCTRGDFSLPLHRNQPTNPHP